MDAAYRSPINRSVKPAGSGEFQALRIGRLALWPPVVLAPMAGVTNYPFRALCRRFGASLCIGEMVTARGLVEAGPKTLKLAQFGADESPRSLQLYGVDPLYLGEAVKRLVAEAGVDHIDLNFGCPVRKVTRKGGGAAIPLKPRLLGNIARAAVRSAGATPVTMKFRIGIDDQYRTFLQAGRIAQEEGCAGVCLHARTAAQLYSAEARWDAIAELKREVTRIPVLGNGDIREAEDALRMMRLTGCDGVEVGRGCLGRPWLFRDLSDVFAGREPPNPPDFGAVSDLMLEHARMLCQWLGEEPAMREFRRHGAWYTKGFRGGARLRQKLMSVSTWQALREAVADTDRNQPFPPSAMRARRGKTGGAQKVSLPEGYLQHLDDDTPPDRSAEEDASGG